MIENKKMNRNGQISFEFLMVIGFGFVFLIPILLFFLSYANNITNEIIEKQTVDIGYVLKKNVEISELYGPGSLVEVEVNVPEEIQNITIFNDPDDGDPSIVYFALDLPGKGPTDIPIFIDAEIEGELNGTCIAQGKRRYYVLNNGTDILIGCKLYGNHVNIENEIADVFTKIIYQPNYRCGDGNTDDPFEECDDGNADDGDGCNRYCFNESFITYFNP